MIEYGGIEIEGRGHLPTGEEIASLGLDLPLGGYSTIARNDILRLINICDHLFERRV